jgi:hypothetical protein
MIGRATRERPRGTVETRFRKVQLVDEGVYHPDWIVLSDVVIDAFGNALPPACGHRLQRIAS